MPSHHRPQKPTAITLKVTNRRVAQPPTPDLSGDEGYSALEDLDESDDEDEEDVYAAEEEHIIGHAGNNVRSPRPLFDIEVNPEQEDDGDDEGDDEDEGVEEEDDDPAYQDDDDDEKSWNGVSADNSDAEADMSDPFAPIHTERHVRFANVPDSDSDDTDTDDDHADMFPDIFVDQAALDPAIRRAINRDPDESSGSGSFWDFQGGFEYNSSGDSDVDIFLPSAPQTAPPSDDDLTPTATPVMSQAMGLQSGVPSPTRISDLPVDLDGFDTDGDDTTEEDVPEPLVRKRSRRSEADDVSDSEYTPVKSDRGKPRVGRFNLDKSDRKPIAVLNPITRKMMIFTPHRHRQLDLSPEQFDFAFYSSVEMTSSSALDGTMMDAMFANNTFGDFVNGTDLGDVDALVQSALMAGESVDDSFDSELGADEGEKSLDIDDFITFAAGELSDSESEHGWGDPNSTPAGPSASDAEMLSHLTSATVGAFRQNQITQQLIFSNKATQDSLAFSGPFNDTAIRGLKSDRLATAQTPLTPTPVRRRRKGDVAEPPTSPLAAVERKRKASGQGGEGHKRQRSISDMALLHV